MPTILPEWLAPYVSVTVFTPRANKRPISRAKVKSLTDVLLDSLADLDINSNPKTVASSESSQVRKAGSWWEYIHEINQKPTWATSNFPHEETTYVYTAIFARPDALGIVSNQSVIKAALRETRVTKGGRLAFLKPIDPKILENAFLTDGVDLRTLHLSGVERPRNTRPESKALTGMRLQDAIQPAEDAGFAFSSARVSSEVQSMPTRSYGVTPRQAKIWTSRATGATNFKHQIEQILQTCMDTEQTSDRVRILAPFATPINSWSDVQGPYEIMWRPADDGSLTGQQSSTLEKLELLETLIEPLPDGSFRVKVSDQVGSSFTASMDSTADTPRLKFDSATEDADPDIKDLLSLDDTFTVYFSTGHAYSSGNLYVASTRRVRFGNWTWDAFDDTVTSKEKPDGARLDDIGPTEASLFSWVVHRSPFGEGWVTCDDGSGEIGDFVAFDGSTISIIHVKAADSARTTRRVSASNYEQVVSQATKNLMRSTVDEILENLGSHMDRLTWLNGQKKSGRRNMIKAFCKLQTPPLVNVVIVQPRMTRTAYDRAWTSGKGDEYNRVCLADSMLAAARSAVTATANDLYVYGQG